ncbi:MAG: MMPL family transporter [Gemmatimonadales bacterium]|nr:MMPL family transporter [Gemmatimonadota bacterium]MBP6668172.1 MMPL family transporter [Gemmatimonadales bacterium]MBP9198386.1 MMPL family transporter [Gemmatimonadales bacterium]
MASALSRALIRWRWAIIVVWAVIGYVAAEKSPQVVQVLNVRGGTREPTEAGAADILLRTRFARPLNDFFAVTLQAPAPVDSGPGALLLDSLLAKFSRQPWLGTVASFRSTGDSTFISKDGRTTFVVVAVNADKGDSVARLVAPVRALVQEAFRQTGVDSASHQVRVTGRSPLDLDVRTVVAADSKRGELRLLPLTAGILLLAFGALVAAVLPLIIGFLAIWVTLAVVVILADYTPMSVFVLNMTTMLGLGVGIDYSLLIVTRFREELNRGLRRQEAAARALSTAGAAVLTSGMTVVVGFAALLLTPLVETQSVGIGGLVVVAVAVALSTTLLPALLAVLGRQIDRPRWLARRLTWYHAPGAWEKWARSLSRNPVRALTIGGAVIALLTAPVFWIKIGLPARNWWPTATEAGQGVQTLEAMGVANIILPVRMVIELPEGQSAVSAASLRGLRALSDSLKADGRVAQVRSLVDLEPGMGILEYSILYGNLEDARARYGGFLDAYLSTDQRVTLIDVVLKDTTSLTSGMDLSRHARTLAKVPPKQLRGATIVVGGYTAASLDLQDVLLRRFPMLVVLILGCTGLMLAIVFRSVLVPIKAVIMNTLSVSATFGLIVLVFQHGIGAGLFGLDGPTSAIFVVVPVLVFAVVFGLSMDYEVFLLARVKEAFDKTGNNEKATEEGLSATASVITSAALIMILVFGVFAFARVLAMQFLGFGLAVAVLLDATIIRMVLVPAIMHLAGEWNWWPGYRRKPKATTNS